MAINIKSDGYYFGYSNKAVIFTKSGKLTFEDNGFAEYEINSNDSPSPAHNTYTLYNVSASNLNKIKKGDHVIIYSGPKDLYGIATEGNISGLQSNNDDGKDKQFTITITEGVNYVSNQIKANFNGAKTVKSKKGTKKVNLSFKKGAKAKEIITKIAKASDIKFYSFKLAKNKVYKRGYMVSNHPFNAIKSIVKACDSLVYQRKGKWVIDDFKTDNPFHEHLFLSIGSGMFAEPNQNDQDNNSKTFTLQCFDDPRLSAGSSVQIKSKVLNGLYRVQSVKHTHQAGSYEMEVIVYA